jgi:transglutaminase-like putative cysteine protease
LELPENEGIQDQLFDFVIPAQAEIRQEDRSAKRTMSWFLPVKQELLNHLGSRLRGNDEEMRISARIFSSARGHDADLGRTLVFGLVTCILLVSAPHAEHLPVWVSGMCAILLAWRAYLAYSGNALPPRWLLMLVTVAGVIAITISFRTLFGREVGVTLLIMLSSLKLLELRRVRDATVLIYLSCFIIITNFFYSQNIPVALFMMVTLIVILATWIHLQATNVDLRKRLRIAVTLLLQAIPLSLLLFVLFPRVQGPLWGMPRDAFASSGLSDTMSPGSLSKLSLSEEIAFRVTFRNQVPARQQMYWRGPVLWDYDGTTWTRGRYTTMQKPQLDDVSSPIEYTVTLEPHDKRWLFALDMPAQLSIPANFAPDNLVLSKDPVISRLRYTATSQLSYRANVDESPQQLARALALPRGYNPQAHRLAEQWIIQYQEPSLVVNIALAYFNQNKFEYTLEPPLLGMNSVDEFLFSTRQGFCEHYAGAFVFLMRAAGIPARVVTGYQGGELNELGGYYILRQSDAHAWAEVWLKNRGWVRVDPTAAISPERIQSGLGAALPDNAALPFMARNPPQWMRTLRMNWDSLANQWNQWVLGYDTEQQFAFLTRLGMEDITWQKLALNMLAGIALLVGLVTLVMLRRMVVRKRDDVQDIWLKLCGKLAKGGLPRATHEGPIDYARRVAAARPDVAAAVNAIARHYVDLRYGDMRQPRDLTDFRNEVAAFKL